MTEAPTKNRFPKKYKEMNTCQSVLQVPQCLFNPPERLDWPCNLTFTIICGTTPRVAIFCLTNIEKDTGISSSCPSAEILSSHYQKIRKAHLTPVGLLLKINGTFSPGYLFLEAMTTLMLMIDRQCLEFALQNTLPSISSCYFAQFHL